jgi:branched-chain amino acid transport system ATP-binding protein
MTSTEKATASLETDGLCVRYGNAVALRDISVTVPAGSVVAVLGSNGAGKSTFARACSGLVPATAGTIRLDDQDITAWPPHRVRRAGLVYLPEGRGILPGVTVGENLRMAVRLAGSATERRAAIDRAIGLFPVLGERFKLRAGSLSGGEQQMLSLARALAVTPRLLIADELSLGLAPRVVEMVFASLQHAKEANVTIVLIEQFVHRALEFADHCVILRRGTVAWSGPASEAAAEAAEAYIGQQAAQLTA